MGQVVGQVVRRVGQTHQGRVPPGEVFALVVHVDDGAGFGVAHEDDVLGFPVVDLLARPHDDLAVQMVPQVLGDGLVVLASPRGDLMGAFQFCPLSAVQVLCDIPP
ncbi:hypothetical protein [Kitasatospora sp. NPDC001547]|uniref:hypothetical protein n=1 Tax=Kitasatospora sp. NPDC001547 TaxID=3364015 RepID=UPI0036BC5BBB